MTDLPRAGAARTTKPPPDPIAVWVTFAAELATNVFTWQALLCEHEPTTDGFCGARQCGTPGRGTPHVTWPCSSWAIADAARRRHQLTAQPV